MLIAAQTSENIRVPGLAFLCINTKGVSYVNQKAGRLLGFKHGDTLRFYHTADLSAWYIANDQNAGATLYKYSGLLRFCDTPRACDIFRAFQVPGFRANFPVAEYATEIDGLMVLQLINKPFNIV